MGKRCKPDQYTAAQFIDAIKGSAGIVSTIASRVGCEWNTAKKYIDTYPTVQAAYINETEKVTDSAEAALIGSIQAKEPWAVKYYLSTKGRGRGYVERTENVIIDLRGASIEQLERIASGEHPAAVMANSGNR